MANARQGQGAFIAALRDIMKERGWTQAALAHAVDHTEASISRLLSRAQRPSARTVEWFAYRLNVPIRRLMPTAPIETPKTKRVRIERIADRIANSLADSISTLGYDAAHRAAHSELISDLFDLMSGAARVAGRALAGHELPQLERRLSEIATRHQALHRQVDDVLARRARGEECADPQLQEVEA